MSFDTLTAEPFWPTSPIAPVLMNKSSSDRIRVSEKTPSETVWKIGMGFPLGSHKTLKRGQKPPYCRFYATKTRDLDPSSYFPNSFSRQFGEYALRSFVHFTQ